MAKRKRGRPPKDPAAVSNERILFRLTAAERGKIDRAVALSGDTLSDWGRTRLLKAASREIRLSAKNSD